MAETPPEAAPVSASRPARRGWSESRKVRCAVIASLFPVAAQVALFFAGEGLSVTLVGMAMAPWMALAGGEAWHDSIKLARGE